MPTPRPALTSTLRAVLLPFCPIPLPLLLATLVAGLPPLAGCKKADPNAAGGKIRVQLDWKPAPQFGGFYAAVQNGTFKKYGLDVEIVPGGVGAPTVDMVSAGTVPFGVTAGDVLVVGRSNGKDLVGVYATYQTSPNGIMTHAARGFKEIGDVFRNDGTVAMQKGLPYAEWLKRKYGFDKVRVVPSPGGSVAAFLSDPNFSQQCFVTEEPILAKRGGGDPQTFLVADSGYNPYTTILITRGDYARQNPEVVRKMALALREGWAAYLADPGPVNEAMHKLNPTMDPATFADSAKAQEPLVRTEETKARGLGSMTRQRWEALGQQLVEAGVIKAAPPADACFVDVDKPAGK